MDNPSNEPIRIGVIGLGMAGAGTVRTLKSHPLVRIVAAADTKEHLLQNFSHDFPEAKTYADMRKLCASPEVEAVYIATPHQFHKDHATVAAESGKHIIVEKPMALTLEECEAMVAAATQHNVALLVGRTASFSPAVLAMREHITNGALGRLGMITMMAYTNFLYRPRRPEELDTSLGGGIIYNQVPHQVDAARLLAGGMTRSIRAVTGVWDSHRPTEGAYTALLTFENGAAASLTYSGYDHFLTDELFYGLAPGTAGRPPDSFGSSRRFLSTIKNPEEEAELRVSMFGYGSSSGFQPQPRNTGEPQPYFDETGVMVVSCEKGDLRASSEGVVIYDDNGKKDLPIPAKFGPPGRGDVVRELYGVIRQGKPPIHDGLWAKATMEVAIAALESFQNDREVHLHHQVPTRDQGISDYAQMSMG